MTDTNDRLQAIEERLTQLETMITEAHKKADAIHTFTMKMDNSYYDMMKKAIHKYGILKEFAETAGPIIIECDRALFPEKAIERSKRLTFVLQNTGKAN